jgi:adenylate cyclase
MGGKLGCRHRALHAGDAAEPARPLDLSLFGGIGFAHLTVRRLEEAAIWLQRAHQEHPRGPLIFAALVSTFAHLGRLDEAREGLSRLLSFGTPTTAAWFQRFAALKNPVDRQFICEGLRKVGVPEA